MAENKEKIQTSNKAKMGEWADNGETKLKVDKVQEYTKWSEIPFTKGMAPAIVQKKDDLRQAIDRGELKVIFVYVTAKNISDRKKYYGWAISGGLHRLHLRGDEGSEQDSNNKNSFYKFFTKGKPNIHFWDISTYIKDPFPRSALISPGGTTKGNVAFVVPSFFTPTVLFTKPGRAKYDDFWGKNEFIIKLK